MSKSSTALPGSAPASVSVSSGRASFVAAPPSLDASSACRRRRRGRRVDRQDERRAHAAPVPRQVADPDAEGMRVPSARGESGRTA